MNWLNRVFATVDREYSTLPTWKRNNLAPELSQASLRDENEQLRVQLAGCSVAATGSLKDAAKRGDYGWSPSYQDVLDLKAKYDAAEERHRELIAAIDAAIERATRREQ